MQYFVQWEAHKVKCGMELLGQLLFCILMLIVTCKQSKKQECCRMHQKGLFRSGPKISHINFFMFASQKVDSLLAAKSSCRSNSSGPKEECIKVSIPPSGLLDAVTAISAFMTNLKQLTLVQLHYLAHTMSRPDMRERELLRLVVGTDF